MLRIGDAEIDLSERRLRGPTGGATLTPLEANLLGFLAERRGATVSREELLRAVWGYAPTVVTRAVDHTISRLRRKIEPDPGVPRWLISSRGGGYRLEPEPRELPALPDEPSSFVGREAELRAVREALASSASVVLLGLGGVGKSRIALRAAHQWQAEGREAVFVRLRSARHAGDVAERVAGALGLQVDRLADALEDRQDTLIVLDEVEHLSDADLGLARTAGPRFLLTTQRPLPLSAEVVPVGPLVAGEAALLVAARAPIPISEAAALAIGSALDGIPFALELAARWLAASTPEELVERLRATRGEPAKSRRARPVVSRGEGGTARSPPR